MSEQDYDEKIFLARMAEQAERYDDMVDHLKSALDVKTDDLSTDERNLVSVGFKNWIGSRRTALRNIQYVGQNPKYQCFSGGLNTYKERIEGELYDQCKDIIKTIEDKLIPKTGSNNESKAFFYKMIGDYYRYIAESAKDERLTEVSNGATDNYDLAKTECESLESYNPIKLGLALNFSVFYFEVKNDKPAAIELADAAYSEAKDKIQDADEEIYRESKGILELIKENLDLWKEEEGEGADPQ